MIRASCTDLLVTSLATRAEALTPTLVVPLMRSKIREPLFDARLCDFVVFAFGTVALETSEVECMGSTSLDTT
jgi:hypothetical protein